MVKLWSINVDTFKKEGNKYQIIWRENLLKCHSLLRGSIVYSAVFWRYERFR